ncbi:MSHA biogenesis protein MshI [Natronospira proteinivora]|uniref:MSHA biogenesis protein MshI n=1 Tax=Natronospira proteinivora TaxID=1807133 RepID=A0ABT1G9V0_9GAMM|nr:hypothetical protein [Natronospira proteinivora]MCP1728099.1 MSHA biogenesis protein MshI [Natronospira proteinivora]
MPLLSFLRNHKRDRRLAGAVVSESGISLACVERGAGDVPMVKALAQAQAGPRAGDDRWRRLEKLVGDHGLSRTPASVLADSDHYQLMLVEAPDVPPEELRSAIRWRIKDLIRFHVDDATIDVFEIPDQKSQAGRLMYAVAAKSPRLKEIIDGVSGAGLKLKVIDLPEMAVRNVAALLDGDVRGLATLYIGVNHGLIIISRQGTLFLARSFEVGEDQLAAASVDERTLLMETIALELQRSLDYYDSHFKQPPVGSIALMPMAVELPFVAEHLESSLGVNVQQVDLNELLESEIPMEKPLQARCLLALGAALRKEEVAL